MAIKKFGGPKAAERRYAKALNSVATAVGKIVESWDGHAVESLSSNLVSYASSLDDWATKAAKRMLDDAVKRDKMQWAARAQNMSRAFVELINKTDIGAAYTKLLDDQISLIKTIPLDAAEKAHDIVRSAQLSGTRAEQSAMMIKEMNLKNGIKQQKWKALRIARTETSRASTALTEVRAKSVGSAGYIWRTSKDTDVRKSHAALDGTFISWDDPPMTDNLVGHAGCVPNCRCYAEPVLRQL